MDLIPLGVYAVKAFQMSENVVIEGTAVRYDKKLLNYFKLAAKIHRNPLWLQKP